MAKSSGHFGKGGVGYFAHNDRTSPTKNAIFSDEKNEVSLSAKEAFKIYRDELKTRSEAYYKRTNQKLQKNTATHRSLIINLNSNHKLEDLKPIKEYLEKQLDTKVLQIAIHRDEGHIDENGKAVKNYHAHFEMMGLDSLGFSLAQHQNTKNKTRADRLDSKFYTKFQDFLSQTLQMERGQKNSKTKRLDTYEYKHHAERTAEKVKEVKQELSYDFKEFQKKITSLETENTELKKQLHKLNSQVKNTQELESKNLKIQELENKIQELTTDVQTLQDHKKALITSISGILKREQLQELQQLEPLQAYKKAGGFAKENILGFKNNANKALERTKSLQEENETLKERLSVYKQDMRVLNTSLIDSRREVQELERQFKNVEKHIETQIPTEFEPKKSLKDRFFGFLKDLKETIKAQATEILSLKTQNQELKTELKEYQELVSNKVKSLVPDEDELMKFKKELPKKLFTTSAYDLQKELSSSSDPYRNEKIKIIDEHILQQVRAIVKNSNAVTREDLQKANQDKGQSRDYGYSR